MADAAETLDEITGREQLPLRLICLRAQRAHTEHYHRRKTSQGDGEAVAVGSRVGMQVASSRGRITRSVSALVVSSISSI